ncbi:MAG: hypothetical protein IPM07_09100 [Anaerolineales bacterium]|nr:hypothetical protein [Anaerolineales bacterium]
MSSVSSHRWQRTGNAGQSDYAMANEVLNRVANELAKTRAGCVVKSIG